MKQIRGFIRAFFGDGTEICGDLSYDGHALSFEAPVSVNSIQNNTVIHIFCEDVIHEIYYRCPFKYLTMPPKSRYSCPVTKTGIYEYEKA